MMRAHTSTSVRCGLTTTVSKPLSYESTASIVSMCEFEDNEGQGQSSAK